MRAVVCSAFGPPESLAVGELPSPSLGPGQIRLRVRAAAVNFPDTLMIKGEYQLRPEMPFAPGFEAAGEVLEVGAEVTGFAPGERVMTLMSDGYGGFAEEAVTDAAAAYRIPAGMDFVEATAFLSPYGTAYHALVQRGRLAAGETLVVLGAAGGVGIAATEIGAALGARVVAVAGSAEKLAIAREHGAAETVDYATEDLAGRIAELAPGGVDVCLDGVGGDAFDALSRRMAWGGRLLVVGFAGGRIPRLPANLLLLKGYAAVGVWFDLFTKREPERNAANFEELERLYAAGQLRPRVQATYPLERVAEALDEVLARRVAGKLVLTLD
jgi:NADPH2:quinone reductase